MVSLGAQVVTVADFGVRLSVWSSRLLVHLRQGAQFEDGRGLDFSLTGVFGYG